MVLNKTEKFRREWSLLLRNAGANVLDRLPAELYDPVFLLTENGKVDVSSLYARYRQYYTAGMLNAVTTEWGKHLNR